MPPEQKDNHTSFEELKAATSVFLGRLNYIASFVSFEDLPPKQRKMILKLRGYLLELAGILTSRLILDDVIRLEALLQRHINLLRAERDKIEKRLFKGPGERKTGKKADAGQPTHYHG